MLKAIKTSLVLFAVAVVVGSLAQDAGAQDLVTSTTLFADVKANGSLAQGNGVVSTQHVTVGAYRVTFNRDITACAFLATIASLGTSGVVATGEITTVGQIGTTNAVFVRTYNGSNVSFDFDERPFSLSVYCP